MYRPKSRRTSQQAGGFDDQTSTPKSPKVRHFINGCFASLKDCSGFHSWSFRLLIEVLEKVLSFTF